jgi:K+-sensing histidine kinase KdpD
MTINLYFLSHILCGAYLLLFSCFIFFKNRKSEINLSFFLFGASIFTWLLFSSGAIVAGTKAESFFWYKLSYSGIVFIPTTFFYFISCLIKNKKKILLFTTWFISLFFLFFLWFSDLFISGVYEYSWGFYPKAAIPLHPIFIAFFNSLFTIALVLLSLQVWGHKRQMTNLQKARLKYVFFGSLLGIVGVIDFLANYGINIYPFGFVFMVIFPTIYGYAIVKYQLMDIRVAVTRAGIFLFVYALVLGTPFWIGYASKNWFIPVVSAIFLATLGPIIYNRLRYDAENVILKDQIHYQKALKVFSSTLIFVKELDELSRKVVAEIMKAIDLQYCALYLRHNSNFQLKYHRAKDNFKLPNEVSLDNSMIEKIKQASGPVFGEHISILENIPIGLVLPLFFNKELHGFILLGEKTKRFFTDTDLDIFNIVASQTSLALSEIFYFSEFQKATEEKFKLLVEKERLQSAFEISEAYRHELGNILNIISTSLGNLMFIGDTSPTKEEIEQTRISINNNVKRGKKIFAAISTYNDNSHSEPKAVRLDELLKAVINEKEEDLTKNNISLKADIGENIVFSANDNFIYALRYFLEGAILAIEYTNHQDRSIAISLKSQGHTAKLKISDTGQDVTADKLYTGIGIERAKEGGILYFIARRIIFDHRGTLEMASFDNGRGSSFIIEIPLLKRGA